MAVTTPKAPPALVQPKLLLNSPAANMMKVINKQKNMETKPTEERWDAINMMPVKRAHDIK